MSEIRFGPAGVPLCSSKRDTLSGIKECSELGLEAMEVEFVRGVKMSSQSAAECGKAANELDISLSAHAPYFINLASEDKNKRKRSIFFITQTAEIAHYLGAGVVVFHAGFYWKKLKEPTYALIKEGIEKAVEIIKENKWNTALAPETMGRQAQFGTLDETLRLCTEIKGVVPAIDFAHIHARGEGSLRKREDFAKILDATEKRLELKHLHIHFTGVEYKNGNEKKHLSLNEGDLDFSLLAEELKDRGLSATIISESPLIEQDALKMKSVWEKVK